MTSGAEPRIGLTGATGVLGSALRRAAGGVTWFPFAGDIRDGDLVRRWIADAGPLDAVMHFAAVVPTARVDQHPDDAFGVNVGGTVHLLEAIRARQGSPQPWVCVISTCHVYKSTEAPLTEEAPVEPVSLYGLTKLQSEQWALAYMKHYGLKVCVPRLFSYSDPGQAQSYFLPSTIARLNAAPPNGTLEIRGAGDRRDFSCTADIVAALLYLWRCRARGVFNVGSGVGVRVLDIVEHLKQLLGRSDVTLQPLPGARDTHLVADTHKIRELGWNPAGTWADLLQTLVAARGNGGLRT